MGQVTIADENIAAWMFVNNTFAKDSLGPAWAYRNGVLVQLCKYEQIPNGDVPAGFGKVKIGNTNEYDNGEFTWINIVCGGGTPMATDDAFLLYSNTVKPTKCDPAHGQANRGIKACFRMKKLHGFNELRGVVTLWQAENGSCTVEAVQDVPGGGNDHNRFTFSFNGNATVTVYEESGGAMVVKAGPFSTDKVEFLPEGLVLPPNGDHVDPPWPTGA